MLEPVWNYAQQKVSQAVTVGASVTMLHVSEGKSNHGVTRSVVAGSTQVGGSFDLGIQWSTPSDKATTGSIDFGLGSHAGVSANIAKEPGEWPSWTGLTAHVGVSSPTLPVQLTVDRNPSAKATTGNYACGKVGVGCPQP